MWPPSSRPCQTTREVRTTKPMRRNYDENQRCAQSTSQQENDLSKLSPRQRSVEAIREAIAGGGLRG